MKQQVTIEVPEGRESVSVEYRWQTNDETCLVVKTNEIWRWPSSLICDWIAMDEMGQWHGYREEPREALATWAYNGPRLLLAPWFSFQPPPCTDWRQSKRRRPGS